jgi:hypothetical protein
VDNAVPSDEPGHGDGSGPQSSAYGSFFHLVGSPEEATHLAALRERFGDEMVDGMQRVRALHEHPRPLTEHDRAVLQEAAAPVLRDMAASGAIVLDIREEAHDDRGAEAVCAWVRGFDGLRGMGISVRLAGSPAERVAELADQLQEFEVEDLWLAGRSATWPECPEHPNSHPLESAVDRNIAVWRCPRTRAVICAIGHWAHTSDGV